MKAPRSFFTILLALSASLLRAQDPSRPDPGFGVGGVAVVSNLTAPAGGEVAIDSQGRIVVVGTVTINALTDVFVFRYLPNGSLDTTFGTGGGMLFQASNNARGQGVAIDEDDNIVVVYDVEITGYRDIFVSRLFGGGANPGTLDASFGPFAGAYVLSTVNSTPAPADSAASGIAVLEDGRIVIAGNVTNPVATNSGTEDLVVTRLTAQGWQDPSFNGGNPTYVHFNGANEYATGVAVDSAGRIFVSANFNAFARVYRLTAAGVPDASVGNVGGAYPLLNAAKMLGNQVWSTGIAVHSDGSVVMCGSQLGGAVTGNKLWVAKYPQASTTADWVTEEDYGGFAELAEALAIQPDGKVVVVGSSTNGPGVAVIRYNADGTRDTTFNNPFGGFAAGITGDPTDRALGVALQRNGAIVVTGSNSTSFLTLRLGMPRIVAPARFAFPSALVKRNARPKTLLLTNTGNALLTGLQFRLAGGGRADFRVQAPSPSTILSGGRSTYRVQFKPLRKGARNAVLQITSANGGGATVRLSGRGR